MAKDKELNELSFKLDRQIDETNLYKVMADQTGLFELLNNQDTLIENLMRLIGEKDQVRYVFCDNMKYSWVSFVCVGNSMSISCL